MEVMKRAAPKGAILRIEYFGEEGVGDGPTREFFTLASQEIQRKSLGLWLSGQENADSEFIFSSIGLFPAPLKSSLSESEKSDILKHFYLLGQVMGRALIDSYLIDIPFSSLFFQLLLGQPLFLSDIQKLFPSEGQHVVQLQEVNNNILRLKADTTLSEQERDKALSHVMSGGSVENADLYFVSITGSELKEGGGDTQVTTDNLGEYLKLMQAHYLGEGIRKQADALRKGFHESVNSRHLFCFNLNELDRVFCGEQSGTIEWTRDEVLKGLIIGTGFDFKSAAIEYFLTILTSFTVEQQRTFLVWVTASRRLPIGGFENLPTKITILRREVEEISTDLDAPTVNVCFKQIYVPNYSSCDIMRKRLLWAMGKGTGKFFKT